MPRGVTVEGDNIYVVESQNNRILKFDKEGILLRISSSSFSQPSGIVAMSKRLFVADKGTHRIVILDESLKSIFEIKNKGSKHLLIAPHDVACLDNRDSSGKYTLCIANSVGNVIVLELYLDNHDEPQAVIKLNIIEEMMGIKLDSSNKNLRSICIIEETHIGKKTYIYVTEIRNGGRLLCLDLENRGRCVYTVRRRHPLPDSRPAIVANDGNTIAYFEFVPNNRGNDGFFIYFYKHADFCI